MAGRPVGLGASACMPRRPQSPGRSLHTTVYCIPRGPQSLRRSLHKSHIYIPEGAQGTASLQGEIQCSGPRPLHWIEPCLAAQEL